MVLDKCISSVHVKTVVNVEILYASYNRLQRAPQMVLSDCPAVVHAEAELLFSRYYTL